MAISNTPSPLSNIIAAKTYNAAWFSGSTKELQITAAIAAAVADGALYVYVPANMLPYAAGSVTFDSAIRMIREGGDAANYDVRAYGAAGDGITDDGAALQAWIDVCSTGTETGGIPLGYLSAGRYRCTRQLVFKSMYVRLMGAGMRNSDIYFDGLGAGVSYFATSVMTYLRPFLSDFRITNNNCTGKGIDFSNITIEVYNGALQNLLIYSGSDCVYAPLFFSMKMDNVWGSSVSGHSFRIQCGPGVVWSGCYAVTCGATKAGYRLGGTINLQSCNGVNSGGYWGVFGNDLTAADGFQTDFTSNDYPAVTLVGCNVEEFTTCGIRIHNQYRNFDFIGGKLDRSALTSAYHSIVHTRLGGLLGSPPVKISATVFIGTGVPNGGAALTTAWLYAGNGGQFLDMGGLVAGGITSYYDLSHTFNLPLLTQSGANDVYGDVAQQFNAIRARRLSVQMIRYHDPAALTPVGAGQTIDVTGRTKVTVTPGAAASVSKATFTQVPGAGDDYSRNGDLIIEAGNGNLTINHNVAGAGGFRMKGAANVTLASGEIRCFMWSANYTAGVAGWIEV